MVHSEGTFAGDGGTKLYYQCWRPEGTAHAVLAIVHGIGEHSGRYMNVVNCLVPDGYAVYGFDLRGHGRSPGQRGFINAWSEFREDVHAFLKVVAQNEPNLPLFLMGHSLGGLIVLEYGLHYQEGLRGVIASGPAVGKVGISPFLFSLASALSRVYPQFSLGTGLDATAISRDASVVESYKADRLVHSKGSARLATEFASAQEWTLDHAGDWRLPLLILHGGADRLSSPEASRAFYERVTFPDKERIEYPGGFHEPHNDTLYPQATADLKRWLNAHERN